MWLSFTKKIICFFHSNYFDYKGAFQTAVDSYRLNMAQNILQFSNNNMRGTI